SMTGARGRPLVAGRIRPLRVDEAQRFYAVHKERPFFGDLVKFMTSGPGFIGVLGGEDAIKGWRDLMGPTDSKKAPKGTVRGEFGTDVEQNASHGSDAPETARGEIAFFFPGVELTGATPAPPSNRPRLPGLRLLRRDGGLRTPRGGTHGSHPGGVHPLRRL